MLQWIQSASMISVRVDRVSGCCLGDKTSVTQIGELNLLFTKKIKGYTAATVVVTVRQTGDSCHNTVFYNGSLFNHFLVNFQT